MDTEYEVTDPPVPYPLNKTIITHQLFKNILYSVPENNTRM